MIYQNLFTIKPNPSTGLFEIEEGEFIYILDKESFNGLKDYLKQKQIGLLGDYYERRGRMKRIQKK